MKPLLVLLLAIVAEATVPHRHPSFDAAPMSAELLFPVPAVSPASMKDSFDSKRGKRKHRAVDIMAPRHSEIVAVADGTIAHLAQTGAGGIAIYQWSADLERCYFYAHLEGYAPDIAEGLEVKRGDVIGYVGTTGNATPGAPHLHFAIADVKRPGQWWGGKAIDPFPVWRPEAGSRSQRSSKSVITGR
jgi:murein DD-endopeptidase MepM/ murein hydrolase activator NlpD